VDTHSDVTHRPTDQHAASRRSAGGRVVASRSRGRRVLRVAAAGAVAALALAGCTSGSGEAGPTTQPTDTPSVAASTPAVTPTPTPTPTKTAAGTSGAPSRPAGIDAHTRDGAARTAQYFFELVPYVLRTGDFREWDRLSVAKQCDFCGDIRKDAKERLTKEWTYSGGATATKITARYDYDTLYQVYPFALEVTQATAQVKDKNGNVVHRSDSATSRVTVEVVKAKVGWKILEVASEDQK